MDARPLATGGMAPGTVYQEQEIEAPAQLAPTPEPRAEALGLLDEILRAEGPRDATTRARAAAAPSPLDEFLNEPSAWRALARWLGLSPGTATAALPGRAEVARRLSRDIARIDTLLARQVNALIHHPSFQKLEASWRGLRSLVDRLPETGDAKIRVLSVTWAELEQDLSNAIEFDQSQLFKKVYESEFGHPGGEPFGILLGDYEVRPWRTPDHPQDDIEVLEGISGVAAAAFAPFVAGAHPSFFELDSFAEMERPLNLPKTFEQLEYLKWRRLRQRDDARFVGLTLPRILMRLPYEPDAPTSFGFRFREEVEAPDRRNYLWGNAVWAFGAVVLRCFEASGWMADIRGVRQGIDDDGTKFCMDQGGLVTGLPAQSFRTDTAGVALKCSTDVIITDYQEKELGELGFIPLCHCYDTEYSAFYGNQSVQQPKRYDEPQATANARLSSMLQYILCVSRFAHYVKVICRDKVGSANGPDVLEDLLTRWLRSYTTASDNAGPEVKAKYPLRESKVQVRENLGAPGSYNCTIHLRPHFQLDQMYTAMRFTTELHAARPS